MAELHNVAGKVFCMGPVNAKMRGVEVCNRTNCRDAAVDEFQGKRKGVGLGV